MFKCKSGALRWNYPYNTMNITFQPPREKKLKQCFRVCFNVTFAGATMTMGEQEDVVFNETFTTTPYVSSPGVAPGPRCVESAGQLDVTIHSDPRNAYLWETTFFIEQCSECERCKGSVLTDLYQQSSYVAQITVDNITKIDNQIEVNFELKKILRRQKNTNVIALINSFLNARQVSVDSCNSKLTRGIDYGLLHSPSDSPQYTFCDMRSVKGVKRALKQAKKAKHDTLDSPVIEPVGHGD